MAGDQRGCVPAATFLGVRTLVAAGCLVLSPLLAGCSDSDGDGDGGVPTPTPTASQAPTVDPTPTPTPTPTQPPATGFPNASNTGVPAGTTLTAYTESCSISTANTTITAKTMNCPNGVLVQAANVTITKSKVTGNIVVDTDVNRTYSLTLTDSEVSATGDLPAIYNGNVTIAARQHPRRPQRARMPGALLVLLTRDSWIHDQWQAPTGDTHLGGVLVLGNVVPCVNNGLRRVRPQHHHLRRARELHRRRLHGRHQPHPPLRSPPRRAHPGQLLGANIGSSFCTYGGAGMEYPADHIVYKGNVFQRGTNACAPPTGR